MRSFNVPKQSGLTLVEIMITLSVMAILAAVSAPSFNGVLASTQQVGTRDQVINALASARSEAVTRGVDVTICAKAKASYSCATDATTKANWQHGWLIYSDSDGNSNASASEVLQAFDPPSSHISFQLTTADAIVFNHRGRLAQSHAEAPVFLLSSTETSRTNALELRPTGRVRICDDWQAETKQCVRNS